MKTTSGNRYDMKVIIPIMAIIFASNTAIAEISCSKELKAEASYVRKMLTQQDSQGSKQVHAAFSTDSMASSKQTAKLSKQVYETNFKQAFDAVILQTEQLVQSAMIKLEQQRESSPVCINRSLIRQVGQENLDAYTKVWRAKLDVVKVITSNDGELSDAVLSEIMKKLQNF